MGFECMIWATDAAVEIVMQTYTVMYVYNTNHQKERQDDLSEFRKL